MTFEKSAERIDEIIKQLSEGDLPLEKAVKLYKEGTQAIAECSAMLDKAQNEMLKVTDADNGGDAV
ncbi:MAG: exodeoxyribonuclease VII small subunit [Oscillospiraceae bacterium]|nr:exodeoxyribonuclease VII small subunit [Oscillospiraceae bacterium]